MHKMTSHFILLHSSALGWVTRKETADEKVLVS